MKKIVYLLVLSLLISCVTSKEALTSTDDITLYSYSGQIKNTIPKNSKVYLSSKKNKRGYKRIKWNSQYGWIDANDEYKISLFPKSTSKSTPADIYKPSIKNSSGGSVQVKGYYRKEGTYVSPHTRRAPSRRK